MPKTLLRLMLCAMSGLTLTTPAIADSTPMLDKLKALESHSHQGRIRILQEADQCIQAAQTGRAYRACEQQEKQARAQLRKEMRPQREALREEFRQWHRARQGPAPTPKP